MHDIVFAGALGRPLSSLWRTEAEPKTRLGQVRCDCITLTLLTTNY